MAFTGLFKTPAQIAAEEREEAYKGREGWEAVGVGLGRMFSGPSDAELRAEELDKTGDELIELYNANAETGSWDDLDYTTQLALGEKYLRKKGYGLEADALFDERKERRTFERAEAEELRAAARFAKEGLDKDKGKGKSASAAQFGTSIENINKWMTNVSDDMSAANIMFNYNWNPNQTSKVEQAFATLQTVPGMTEAKASTILRTFVKPDDDMIDPEISFDIKSFDTFVKNQFPGAFGGSGKSTQQNTSTAGGNVLDKVTSKPLTK